MSSVPQRGDSRKTQQTQSCLKTTASDEIERILTDLSLESGEKVVLIFAIRRAAKSGEMWWKRSKVAETLNLSVSVVDTAFRKYARAGRLQRIRRGRQGNENLPNTYRFLWHPEFTAESLLGATQAIAAESLPGVTPESLPGATPLKGGKVNLEKKKLASSDRIPPTRAAQGNKATSGSANTASEEQAPIPDSARPLPPPDYVAEVKQLLDLERMHPDSRSALRRLGIPCSMETAQNIVRKALAINPAVPARKLAYGIIDRITSTPSGWGLAVSVAEQFAHESLTADHLASPPPLCTQAVDLREPDPFEAWCEQNGKTYTNGGEYEQLLDEFERDSRDQGRAIASAKEQAA